MEIKMFKSFKIQEIGEGIGDGWSGEAGIE